MVGYNKNRRQRRKEAGREAHGGQRHTEGTERVTDGGGEEGKQTQGEKETKGEKWTKGEREEGNRPAKGERRREAKGQEPAGMEKDREKAEEEGDELHSDAPQGRQSPRPVPRRHIWLEEPALPTPTFLVLLPHHQIPPSQSILFPPPILPVGFQSPRPQFPPRTKKVAALPNWAALASRPHE